ncbi:MAG: hypothetical protein KAY37_11765 [Phycisphaerae bacterium]|nr:hypothetical protein [Phycisphaerae bacterium]
MSVPAAAHRGHSFGNPFHDDVSLAQACKLAEEEFKLVYIYVTKPGGSAVPYLERPTWSDWRAIDLLIREVVAVKLDGRRHAAELRQYKLGEPPAMLVIEPDGTERQRLSGDLSAEQLMLELVKVLSDEDSVARVRAAVKAAGGAEPLSRERLAAILTRHGAYQKALEQYLWCLAEGLRNVPYATARRRLLLKNFVALTVQYPPARSALEKRRQEMEHTLRNERDDANLARDLAELNRCLDDEARTLALFDQLPPRSRARSVLFDRVLDQLIRHKRYDEVLGMVEPLQVFRQEVLMARQRGRLRNEGPEARYERGTRAFAVGRGAALVEALAGVGRTDEAHRLSDKIIRFDDRPETYRLLRQHARRAESRELTHYLETKSATTQPDRQP